MRRFATVFVVAIGLAMSTSSCYSHRFVIGDGPQTGVEVKGKNHFFLYGLIAGPVSDPQELAGGATDFEVTEVHTFVDGLINALTFGIYNPTTTKVQR